MPLKGTDKIYNRFYNLLSPHPPAPPRLTDLFKPSEAVPSSATGQDHNIAPFEENVTVKLSQIVMETAPHTKMERTNFTVHHGSMTFYSILFYSKEKAQCFSFLVTLTLFTLHELSAG